MHRRWKWSPGWSPGSIRRWVVEGEAGIGKTRLLDEVLEQTGKQGLAIVRGTGGQLESDLPFAPFVDALGLAADAPRDQRAAIGALLVGAPTTASEQGLGADSTQRRLQVAQAILDLDYLAVGVESDGPSVEDTLRAGARACLWAEHTSEHTEQRGADEVQVRVKRIEDGCADQVAYRFDARSWQASAAARIPTTVRTFTHEGTADGWRFVGSTEQPAPEAADVQLTWQGTFAERPGPWITFGCFGICIPSRRRGPGVAGRDRRRDRRARGDGRRRRHAGPAARNHGLVGGSRTAA